MANSNPEPTPAQKLAQAKREFEERLRRLLDRVPENNTPRCEVPASDKPTDYEKHGCDHRIRQTG